MIFSEAIQNALASGGGIHTEVLFRMIGRNRTTGLSEVLALWTGSGERSFTIDGEAVTYLGGGELLDIPEITYEIGLAVRYISLGLSGASPAVRTAFFTHNMKHAAVNIHVAFFDPATMALIDTWRAWKGLESETKPSRAAQGGREIYTVSCASTARFLTMTNPGKKSHASMQAAHPGDDFRKYATTVKGSQVVWKA